jgi:tetratricopeptide (TPR) repeat protein
MNIEPVHLDFLIRTGRFKEAEAILRSSLAKDPDDAYLHMDLSRALCRLERPKEAEEAARCAIALHPDSGSPYDVLAEALLASSKLKDAEEAINQAVAVDGRDADRCAMLARIYQERDRQEASLQHANDGLAIDPDHDVCLFFRAIALGKLGRHEEADHASLALLSDDPEDSANHCGRGWILLERHAVPEAQMHFQEALRLDPENEVARMGLARCLQQGNPLLGWLLRFMLALDRIPVFKVIIVAVLLGVVLPGFLKGKGQPEILRTTGVVISAVFMLFFYLVLVARPIFDVLLALSRKGRAALGRYEMRAVRWCCLPLLAGFVYLGLWLANGSRSIPFDGIGWLSAAALLHEAVSNRHPWVRRRMLGIAGVACSAALWFSAGPPVILRPLALEVVSQLKDFSKEGARELGKKDLVTAMERLMSVRKWAFLYPALLIYLVAAYSDDIAGSLKRRAPDETD